MREVGSAQFTYREIRDWGEFPPGWTFEDTPGVAVDSQDRVYAFTREKNGIVVFNPDGSLGEIIYLNVLTAYLLDQMIRFFVLMILVMRSINLRWMVNS